MVRRCAPFALLAVLAAPAGGSVAARTLPSPDPGPVVGRVIVDGGAAGAGGAAGSRQESRLRAGAVVARPALKRVLCGRKPRRGQGVCVHWNASGGDAPPRADADHNGIPDFVQRTLRTVEHVRDVYRAAGYRPPPSDGALGTESGGGPQTDVYLLDVGADGIYGYCASETDPPVVVDGPQPATLPTAPAYCVFDNDFRHRQFPDGTPLSNLHVTAAHEFFHVVQFGYDTMEDLWIMEATATWAEDEVYGGINDNRQYLPYGPLGRPGRPLDAAGTPARFHEYGAWLFFRYLSEHFPASQAGMPTIVRAIWRRLDAAPGGRNEYSTQAVARVLSGRGWSLTRALVGFAAADRSPRTSYAEGGAYPVAPATRVVIGPGAPNPPARSRVEDHLTWHTWRFVPHALDAGDWRLRLTFDLAPVARGSLASVTVVRRDGGRSTERVHLDARGNAVRSWPFSSGSIAAVEVTLLNRSTHGKCWVGTFYACSGRSYDDGLRQVVDPRAFRR